MEKKNCNLLFSLANSYIVQLRLLAIQKFTRGSPWQNWIVSLTATLMISQCFRIMKCYHWKRSWWSHNQNTSFCRWRHWCSEMFQGGWSHKASFWAGPGNQSFWAQLSSLSITPKAASLDLVEMSNSIYFYSANNFQFSIETLWNNNT